MLFYYSFYYMRWIIWDWQIVQMKSNAFIFGTLIRNFLYNGLFGSIANNPNCCNAAVAASALAFFLLSLATVGWKSCPFTTTLKIYCFLCAGPQSNICTNWGGPQLEIRKEKSSPVFKIPTGPLIRCIKK